MSLPIPQMIFGTVSMLIITAMVYDFVDPHQCDGVTDTEDKKKCNELTNMIFASVLLAWTTYVGIGVLLYLLGIHVERNEQKVKNEYDR